MIGLLPTKLKVGNTEREIRTDFRVTLNILAAFNDPNLDDEDGLIVMLRCLYVDSNFNETELEDALKKAVWFIDGGNDVESQNSKPLKLYDWEQDEMMIFSAVNKVAGKEVRLEDNLHWWTFLGYFSEIGEGTFSSVVNIRNKKATGKKLEKNELEFYKKNKSLIDIKPKYSDAEIKQIEYYEKLLNGEI